MNNPQILWADDEIDLLKPHIMFLQKKGYDVITVTNGQDALDYAREHPVDLVFLDENMPGISGLETLSQLKESHPSLPIIMITKSEEEDIMDQAIGSKIADYLIKPVLPNQMLMSIKKNLHAREITQQQQTSGYQQEFGKLSMAISDAHTFNEWVDVYKRLVFWENEFSANSDPQLNSMLQMQKEEANAAFYKFVKRNYQDWVKGLIKKASPSNTGPLAYAKNETKDDAPLMSPSLFKERIFPLLDAGEKLFLIVIDNFRLDQWKAVQPLLSPYFTIQEDVYCAMLPTATQYARNAIFSGLMPDQIARMFPDLWVDEDEEECKNLNEAPLIQTQLDRCLPRFDTHMDGTFLDTRPLPFDCRDGLQGDSDHRSRIDSLRQCHQDHRRQERQYQPSLQTRQEPQFAIEEHLLDRASTGFRPAHPERQHTVCVLWNLERKHTVCVLWRARFLCLPEQLQLLRSVLQGHFPAWWHLARRDAHPAGDAHAERVSRG